MLFIILQLWQSPNYNISNIQYKWLIDSLQLAVINYKWQTIYLQINKYSLNLECWHVKIHTDAMHHLPIQKKCPVSTYLWRADCTQANTNQRCCDKSKRKVSSVKIARWYNIRTRHTSAITIFVAFWGIKQEITRAESFVQKGSAEYNSKELNEWIVGGCAGEWVLQTFSTRLH